ncbi:MAG: single-stranded-DNA-specific exonuclease RecJ [Sphaerochaetaceae bacterium]
MVEWKKEQVSVELVRRLNELYGMDLITASLLARRGVTEADQVKYFLETDVSYLHNPFLFEEMETFTDRILQAREEHGKVCIFGDRDVDGITATVLLKKELDAMGIDTSWRLPDGDEPYGLTMAGIDAAAAEGVTLIITVDCGISNLEEVSYARRLGIDVLITDHHLGGEQIPAAIAVIDPKLEGSGYPFNHLAGCGVVVKCIWALRFALSEFYQEEVLLLHALPGNTTPGKETVIVQAVRMKNLVEEDRVIEEVVPGVLEARQSRLINFLDCGLPILALDTGVELTLLKRAFGKSIEIQMGELRPLLESVLPQTVGKSLFSLMQVSRAVLYTRNPGELDLLVALFTAYVNKMVPGISSDFEPLLDLVAIGTIADLMPMVDENRIMVRRGLGLLAAGTRKELLPLFTMQNLLGKVLSTSDIGWQITPVINASGRLGKPQIAAQMLLATDMRECEERAGDLIRLNKERQKQGEESWERLLPKAKRSHSDFNGKFLMVEDASVSRGMTGVLASRFLKQFNVPSLVIAYIDDERVTGSMRSPVTFNVRDFLNGFKELFLDFGGHQCAGGFSMERKYLDELRKRIILSIESLDDEGGALCEGFLRIDAELPAGYLTPRLIELVERFEPYGEANPPIQFYIRNAVLDEVQYLNNTKGNAPGHLKLQLSYGDFKWPAIYWGAADLVGKDFNAGDDVDVVFKMGRNYYRNNESLQLTVLGLRRHKTELNEISIHEK